MAIAIFVAAIAVGGAINPEWVAIDPEHSAGIGFAVGWCAIYDALNLVSKLKQ